MKPRKSKKGRRATDVTPKKAWYARALKALAAGATVSEAAQAANIARYTIYRSLESDPDFKTNFDDAVEQGTDLIESEATRRAVIGVAEPVIYQGQVTFVGVDVDGNECDPNSPLAVRQKPLVVHKPSDTLAIFLLKGRRPQKFRDNVTHEITGKGGGPIQSETKHVVDYDAIEAELTTIAAGRMASGVPADN